MSKYISSGATNSPSYIISNFIKIARQAFAFKKNPLPWSKAIRAGICSALPVIIGLLAGNFQYGLYAGIGGFTFLYMFNEPYAQRAKKLFFVALGLAVSIGLGTFLAPNAYAVAIMIGLIGAAVTFIFGALKIPGPAAVFFVLTFAMTSVMEIDPSQAPLRAGLVFLGGALSWVIAMFGWFFNPRGPEINALKAVYQELAKLLESVGTKDFSEAREKTLLKIKNAENILLAGYVSWNKSSEYKKLYLLYEQANQIFSKVLEFYEKSETKLSSELGESVRGLANLIGQKAGAKSGYTTNELVENRWLVNKIKEAEMIILEDEISRETQIHIVKPSWKSYLSGAFHKNSIVFIYALRYGVILTIASLIAFSFGFERSYWIPLSCAAVMLGSTIVTTFNRSIQRTIGTIIGVLIAMSVLSTHPDGYLIALVIFIFTFLTELFIPINYAIAVFFITPNSIFMAENTTQIYNISHFASARILDILIGCAIGLIGTFLIGRRSASSRLPHLISKTIRSQMQYLILLFSEQPADFDIENSGER